MLNNAWWWLGILSNTQWGSVMICNALRCWLIISSIVKMIWWDAWQSSVMLSDAMQCSAMLSNAWWCLAMFCDAGWHSMMLSNANCCLTMLGDAQWCSAMLGDDMWCSAMLGDAQRCSAKLGWASEHSSDDWMRCCKIFRAIWTEWKQLIDGWLWAWASWVLLGLKIQSSWVLQLFLLTSRCYRFWYFNYYFLVSIVVNIYIS